MPCAFSCRLPCRTLLPLMLFPPPQMPPQLPASLIWLVIAASAPCFASLPLLPLFLSYQATGFHALPCYLFDFCAASAVHEVTSLYLADSEASTPCFALLPLLPLQTLLPLRLLRSSFCLCCFCCLLSYRLPSSFHRICFCFQLHTCSLAPPRPAQISNFGS